MTYPTYQMLVPNAPQGKQNWQYIKHVANQDISQFVEAFICIQVLEEEFQNIRNLQGRIEKSVRGSMRSAGRVTGFSGGRLTRWCSWSGGGNRWCGGSAPTSGGFTSSRGNTGVHTACQSPHLSHYSHNRDRPFTRLIAETRGPFWGHFYQPSFQNNQSSLCIQATILSRISILNIFLLLHLIL